MNKTNTPLMACFRSGWCISEKDKVKPFSNIVYLSATFLFLSAFFLVLFLFFLFVNLPRFLTSSSLAVCIRFSHHSLPAGS